MTRAEWHKDRLATVQHLRALAKHWTEAGAADRYAGPSWWNEQDERLKKALLRCDQQFNREEPLTAEDAALIQATMDLRQTIWRRAGEILLSVAQARVDDARKEMAEVEAVCRELEGRK